MQLKTNTIDTIVLTTHSRTAFDVCLVIKLITWSEQA